MTLAFDQIQPAAPHSFTASSSYTHTPVGTPRGIVVLIAENVGTADVISAVTYGGVAMARVGRATDAAGEPGQVYAYFLGSGIPTGAQTVSITVSSGTTAKRAVSISVMAAMNTRLAGTSGFATATGDQANPSVSITGIGASTAAYAVGAFFSGLNAPTMTAGTGYSELEDDFGNQTCSFIYRDAPTSGGAVTVDWSAGSDDVAAIGVAIQETAIVVSANQATETDAAETTVPLRTKTVGLAASTETGQVVTPLRVRGIAQAEEVDLAEVVTPFTEPGQTIEIGQALEIDTAEASTALRVYGLVQAEETDAAFDVARLKARSVAQASETDEAQPVGRAKLLAIGQAQEIDETQVLTAEHRVTLGQAAELDEAFGVGAPGAVPVNQAQETDEAGQITASRLVAVSMVEESDEAHPIAAVGRIGTGVFRGPSKVRIRVRHNEVT